MEQLFAQDCSKEQWASIYPKLIKSSMEKLDRSKLLFLKAAFELSKRTSNTFALALAGWMTLCEDR